MLTHRIYKPLKTVRQVVQGVYEIGQRMSLVPHQYPKTAVPAIIDSRVIDNDHEGGTSTLLPASEVSRARNLLGSKIAYNEYIATLRLRFKKGDLVTLRMYPIILNRTTPPAYYEVYELQEIRHLAQWDANHKEPRVVGVIKGERIKENTGIGAYSFVCPSALRPLTDQEKFLVNVQHLQTSGTRSEQGGTSSDDPASSDGSDPADYAG